MRINVYSQELTPEVASVEKRSNTGVVYCAAIMTKAQQAELEQVARELWNLLEGAGPYFGPIKDLPVKAIMEALAAQRANILKEVLASFEKHHDECNDFRHCECASGFWYEWVGKSWMDAKQSEERS